MARGPVTKAANKWSRKLHRWAALAAAAPIVVIILSGILLQWKKEVAWVQPPEMRGAGGAPTVPFDRILETARAVPQAEVATWDDIARLDVRPDRGIVKVQCRNHWELQIDTATGGVLSSTHRRSDLIESIHDGSFFHPAAKHWLFFPCALLLLGLWLTGIYLWILPIRARRAGRIRRARAPARRA